MVRTLPPQRGALVDETGRTETFEDNLVSSLTEEQVAILREQLSSGDGRELDPSPTGARPDAHAAHSSSALAFNAFGAWFGHEHELVLDGVSGFTDRLRVEARQRIFRGGRAPNLDCLLTGPDVVIGVESKLTEPLTHHHATTWSSAYGRETSRALLSGGWLQTLDDALSGRYRTRYIDADQLLKHALGLSKQHRGRVRHLLYVYWEPINGDDFKAIIEHRAEVAELVDRVGGASPHLHALSYAELWQQWDGLANLAWLAPHLEALRHRYAITL